MPSYLQKRKENKEALGKVDYWLRYCLPFWLIIPAAAYIGSVWAVGGNDAWELVSGLASPNGMKAPVFTWTLSVIGWMLIPAIIGVLAGIAVEAQLSRRRNKSSGEVAEDLDAKADKAGGGQ
ncbi:DUF6313 family protein [Streptomyces sp. NBC_01367]|uniref:DUF6313 family protein n=1 Tax=Streptomyces sp. NBC_01367 TaxID=2903841 RepID=UPI0032436B3E